LLENKKPTNMGRLLFVLFLVIISQSPAGAQLITMSKSCRTMNEKGKSELKAKNYSQALETFNSMKSKCNSKDGKEAGAVGRAEALNGLNRYEEAIKAADEAIKVSKNTSIMGYFQKAVAQNRLKQVKESRETFQHVLDLTEKNVDTKTRAQNYSLMSLVYSRQLYDMDSGFYYINKAIELDGSNPNFFIQRGDMYSHAGDWDKAFNDYDKAVSLGKGDMEIYQIRTEKRIEMVQKKYGTTNGQELGKKMNQSEKQMVCGEWKKAKELGMKVMQIDLFAAIICN
jgi:tetratricopeptide (TPR) repeat protein